jgi:hypothetical protein
VKPPSPLREKDTQTWQRVAKSKLDEGEPKRPNETPTCGNPLTPTLSPRGEGAVRAKPDITPVSLK